MNGAQAPLRTLLDGYGRMAGRPAATSRPDLDFVALAHGMGVHATRARTGDELAEQFAAAVAEPGPHLLGVVVPPLT